MIKLPAFFSHGMVINKKARIWGWAKTSVTLAFMGKTYEAVPDGDGRFEAEIIADEYGGPHVLTVGDTVIHNVYVGHVWLCGGQSNMEQPISRTRPLLDEYIKENPQIRAFQVEKGIRFDGPARDVNGSWQSATGDFLGNIFAVPYFFAQALEKDTPIGLINIAAGGTPAEAWLPEDIIRTFPGFYERLEAYKQPGYAAKIEQENQEATQKWHEYLDSKDFGLAEGWHSPYYNHDHWPQTMLLDQAGKPDYGVIWYRKDIHLPKDFSGSAYISLGRVTDSVTAYVNGKIVAEVGYQYPPCRGVIPEGLLKPGKNTIAIRAIGSVNKHNFAPGKKYELTHPTGKICLLGPWHWRQGCKASISQAPPGVWLYNIPTCTYNYMLAPVLGYGIDGVIWYQGESNTASPEVYKNVFEAFVTHLRKYFGEIPVIFTQLANYVDPSGNGENWAKLRDQQRKCLEISNTAMAVTIDCGEYNDLHPQDKRTVGQRLALCARSLAYGEDIPYSGPIVNEALMHDGEIIITFHHGEGLWAKNGRPVVELIDENGVIHYLTGEIRDDNLVVQARSISVKQVRFGWMDCPTVALYNAYCIPASSFKLRI
ncbi:MAG: sialate O-acetylesterase [Defluviitaleaceae bacterium]|nr:sialate O-acetylesterase [Defluviitaleaceae bacterium]